MSSPPVLASASPGMSRKDEHLSLLQEAVINKKYTLFDAARKDGFNTAFLAMSREERKRLVAQMKSGLADDDLTATREAVATAMRERAMPRHRSSVARWVGFLTVWLIALKTSFSASFGAEGLLWGFVDVVLGLLYLGALAWQDGLQSVRLVDGLIVFPAFAMWFRTGELVRFAAALWRSQRDLRAVSEGSVTRLVGLLLVLVTLGHLVSCGWFALAVFQGNTASFGPAEVFSDRSSSRWLTYGRVYFFALKSLTGGPDGSPGTGLEILLALAIVVLGFSVTATTVGSIGSALSGFDADREAWIAKNDEANRYAKANSLPDALFRRITDYYQYLKENRRSHAQPQEIFYELPSSLQTDISLHLTKDLLSQVSFFRGAPLACLSFIAKQLRPLAVPPGERIVTEGEVGETMYFLMRGLLEVTSGLRVVSLLEEGAVFGEMALLMPGQPRTATIRALVFSDVFELSNRDLDEVLKLWPALRDVLTATMQRRMEQMKEVTNRAMAAELDSGKSPKPTLISTQVQSEREAMRKDVAKRAWKKLASRTSSASDATAEAAARTEETEEL